MNDPLADLWTTQARDARPLDPAALVAAEAAFRRRIGRRDLREYAAGVLGGLFFAAIALAVADWGVRTGALLIVVGIVVVLANLHRRRPVEPDPALAMPARAFLRAQLAAQCDALAQVWRWYLLPLVPGLVVFVLATAWPSLAEETTTRAIARAALDLLPLAMILGIVEWLNRAAAHRLQQRIDALDRDLV